MTRRLPTQRIAMRQRQEDKVEVSGPHTRRTRCWSPDCAVCTARTSICRSHPKKNSIQLTDWARVGFARRRGHRCAPHRDRADRRRRGDMQLLPPHGPHEGRHRDCHCHCHYDCHCHYHAQHGLLGDGRRPPRPRRPTATRAKSRRSVRTRRRGRRTRAQRRRCARQSRPRRRHCCMEARGRGGERAWGKITACRMRCLMMTENRRKREGLYMRIHSVPEGTKTNCPDRYMCKRKTNENTAPTKADTTLNVRLIARSAQRTRQLQRRGRRLDCSGTMYRCRENNTHEKYMLRQCFPHFPLEA